ncbi:hypothetical protein NFB56_09885 [Yersinia ruckeri]|uniref:hypothetical protein n=1 Tax=Yersinia ruckeri TaxID=29486 RepID=UPI001F1E11D3|nr:hypothetical protein [Yersinia ruckeri]EKN3347921.1 hypothetical protein [Yersinia ruckeri]ELM3748837.1 hypothetical protein [Yersinia ruckeri]MCK8562256.1 hypothetical protein [Yersinia ruckeri]MCW6549166.1 hypothetical protein [Yersinia ruckeri]MCW6635465.1 hypothetical protein [Yersinia ruckeri]
MSNKPGILCVLAVLLIQSGSVKAVNEATITENGRVATLVIPLKATITDDMVVRETIDVTPMSSLYENATWNKATNKFSDHQLLLRVTKSERVPVLVEIINDQYTCAYNNPDWMANQSQPAALVGVNTGYTYSLLWSGNTVAMPAPQRSARVDNSSSWQQGLDGNYFLDLTLNMGFPVVSSSVELMSKGGFCQGSVSMLISRTL